MDKERNRLRERMGLLKTKKEPPPPKYVPERKGGGEN